MSRSIGDYVISRKLGAGSFATVYRAQNRVTGLEVAVKAIAKEKLNRKLQENLESEISILKQLRHPNIVKLLDTQQTDRHFFLILEFCAGGDVSRYIRKRGTLSEPTARRFMRQLASGLEFLRQHNLIHRDLKPQNLLLSSDDEFAVVKIADFGFARYIAPQTLVDTLCGSPLYMAPEILKSQKYDAKADLWSVGAILYEVVVGHPPFSGSNHVQLLQNIEKNEVRFPENVPLSPACIDLLKTLLKRNPLERCSFQDFFSHSFVSGASDDSPITPAPPENRDSSSVHRSPPPVPSVPKEITSPISKDESPSIPSSSIASSRAPLPTKDFSEGPIRLGTVDRSQQALGTETTIQNTDPTPTSAAEDAFMEGGASSSRWPKSSAVRQPKTNPFKNAGRVESPGPPMTGSSSSRTAPVSATVVPAAIKQQQLIPAGSSENIDRDYVIIDSGTLLERSAGQTTVQGQGKGSVRQQKGPTQDEVVVTDVVSSCEAQGKRALLFAELGDEKRKAGSIPEAAVLLVKALQDFEGSIVRLRSVSKALTLPSLSIEKVFEWLRIKFLEYLSMAEYLKDRILLQAPEPLPDCAERIVFNHALELARKAAVNECVPSFSVNSKQMYGSAYEMLLTLRDSNCPPSDDSVLTMYAQLFRQRYEECKAE
mmetsp:Transcript_46299/g.75577  ORF Transcript_46299/g.75577 Transcript_46299/m.75577 type:complete len:655 (+) Transcript_46299:90-2054(+)|eukprot:CAMPEP_0184658674 /NCGR_PEP_ID=MMETSP0308-20130426/26450_1 /TAXON_ID=38269 /ORGANISM="Gloeochaete witrockiana, Strain SAG 46.84" /LENGTH=654 /DNA_ID=CAMNT_0027097845 /DNA_START=32 /DNA_END=1996 /DNA_ORIENTATION=-